MCLAGYACDYRGAVRVSDLEGVVRRKHVLAAGYSPADATRLMRRAARIAGGGVKPGRYWYVPRAAFDQAVAETREHVEKT
jgi:hypothetical protein